MTKAYTIIGGLAIVASLLSAGCLCASREAAGVTGVQDIYSGENFVGVVPADLTDVLVVTTDKSIYLPGEPVNITATFPMGYSGTFPTSLTMYFMIVDSDGTVLYDMSKHVIVLMVITHWNVPAGYSRSFIWNQCDDNKVLVGFPKWLEAKVVVPAWYYPVSASAGFEINPMPTSYDLALLPGWNLVYLPILNDSWTAGGIGLKAGSIVVGWDEPIQKYTEVYVVGVTPDSRDFRLMIGNSYMVFTSEAQTLTLLGCSPEVFDKYSMPLGVPAKGGWACLGFNSLGPGPNASSIDGLVFGADVLMVCKWNPVSCRYQVYVPGVTPPSLDFVIGPGEGCWLRISGPGELRYSP